MPTRIDPKLSSELKILMEKEKEMRLHYDRMLRRVDDPRVRRVLEKIRDQETRHEGYVRLIKELVSL